MTQLLDALFIRQEPDEPKSGFYIDTYFCKKYGPLVHLVGDPSDYEYMPITADEYVVLRVMVD